MQGWTSTIHLHSRPAPGPNPGPTRPAKLTPTALTDLRHHAFNIDLGDPHDPLGPEQRMQFADNLGTLRNLTAEITTTASIPVASRSVKPESGGLSSELKWQRHGNRPCASAV